MTMSNWPRLTRDKQPAPSYFVELSAGSFAGSTQRLWFIRARTPTAAVVGLLDEKLRRQGYRPTPDFQYRVWHASSERKKGLELTEIVEHAVVEAQVGLYRELSLGEVVNYTVLWTYPYVDQAPLYWMTLQARTTTEALLIAQASSAEFKLVPDYCSQDTTDSYFSIYEGWHKPLLLSGHQNLSRLPSVLMSEDQDKPKVKTAWHEPAETTNVSSSALNLEIDEEAGAPIDFNYEYVYAKLSGRLSNLAETVNFALLEYLAEAEDSVHIKPTT